MKLSMLLHCTGCTKTRYDALRRREQLPFVSDGDGEPSKLAAELSKRQVYSLEDAFLLKMMLDVIDAGGVSVREAHYLLDAINPCNFERTLSTRHLMSRCSSPQAL